MDIERKNSGIPSGNGEFNLDTLSDAQRSSVFELRGYRDTWSNGADETVDFAFNEAQMQAQEFLKTHPDAHQYALFQILIGGSEDASLTKVDYPSGELLELARAVDKRIRDFQTGTSDAA